MMITLSLNFPLPPLSYKIRRKYYKMTKEEIIDIILKNKKILKKYKVKYISLFGSYVRNEQKEDGDVDLLVEFKV